MTISADQLARYERDGFLIVERLFSNGDLAPAIDEIAAAVEALAERLLAAGKITSTHAQEGFYGRMAAIAAEYDQAPGLFQIGSISVMYA